MAGRSAELSVVIVTPDCYETIGKTMGYLRAQTARDRLEIVIVAPSTLAKGVRTCGLRRAAVIMCSVGIPRASSASAMRERWHRQGTASAHIIAVGARCATSMSSCNPC